MIRVAWLSAFGLLALTACSSPPVPEDRFYRLADLADTTGGVGQRFSGSLAVEMPRAAGIRRQRAILYSNDPEHLELRRHRYHLWEAPPPDMIQQRMLRRFRPLATTVTDRPVADTDYRIQTKLHRFEREVDRGSVTAVVAMDFMILPGRGSNDPLLEKQYSVRVSASSTEMIASARAFSDAVDQIIDQFLGEVREQPAR